MVCSEICGLGGCQSHVKVSILFIGVRKISDNREGWKWREGEELHVESLGKRMRRTFIDDQTLRHVSEHAFDRIPAKERIAR